MNEKRNSIVILAKNINMDKEYENIIDYSESDLVSLLRSNDHLVMEQNNYSFLKVGENRISVGIPYAVCLRANYIALQNPYYSNKWFFAFIDSVEYSSEKSTIISYTVDEISTWWSYWTKKTCYVEREHVNDDTLGLHTIPEGLETGEYHINGIEYDNLNSSLTVIMATTQDPNDGLSRVGKYNGVPAGVGYYRYDTMGTPANPETNSLLYALRQLAGDSASSAVVGMFMAPKWLCGGDTTTIPVANSNNPEYSVMNVTPISNIDGYTPKNKKCLCFPYCFMELSNNIGQANVLYQERWNRASGLNQVQIVGALTPGCSVRAYPLGYNGVNDNYEEGISLGKFPQLNWNTDQYTNWLTANGVSIGGIRLDAVQVGVASGLIETGANIGLSSIMPGEGMTDYTSGLKGVFQTMQENYRHSLIPNTINGSLNNGDVITSDGLNKFCVIKKTVKREFIESIDSYFTRFGYKVNSLKVPNFTGRKYWNFVKIANGEIVGYANNDTVNVPESSMDIINKIFRKGTTIWHNHDNIGNYNLDNVIE